MSAVESNDPGGPGGVVAFAGGALPESIFAVAPGAVEAGAIVLTAAVASLPLVAALASESGGMADFVDTTASWGGGLGVTTSFGGSGSWAGAGVVEAGTSLVATRLSDSLGNSMR